MVELFSLLHKPYESGLRGQEESFIYDRNSCYLPMIQQSESALPTGSSESSAVTADTSNILSPLTAPSVSQNLIEIFENPPSCFLYKNLIRDSTSFQNFERTTDITWTDNPNNLELSGKILNPGTTEVEGYNPMTEAKMTIQSVTPNLFEDNLETLGNSFQTTINGGAGACDIETGSNMSIFSATHKDVATVSRADFASSTNNSTIIPPPAKFSALHFRQSTSDLENQGVSPNSLSEDSHQVSSHVKKDQGIGLGDNSIHRCNAGGIDKAKEMGFWYENPKNRYIPSVITKNDKLWSKRGEEQMISSSASGLVLSPTSDEIGFGMCYKGLFYNEQAETIFENDRNVDVTHTAVASLDCKADSMDKELIGEQCTDEQTQPPSFKLHVSARPYEHNRSNKTNPAPTGSDLRKDRRSSRSNHSKFCHICTRLTRREDALVCGNFTKRLCRKIICSKCAAKTSFGSSCDDKILWTCTHCRNVSRLVKQTLPSTVSK